MCGWAFLKQFNLKKHVDSVHLGVRGHMYDKCGQDFYKKFSCQNTFDIHIDTCQVQRDRSDFDCEDSKAEDTEESVDDEAEIPTEKSEFCNQTSKTQKGHNENSAKHNLGNEDQNEKESELYKKLPIPCDHCPRCFTTSVGVNKIEVGKHKKSFNCSECASSFNHFKSAFRTNIINY